ncbi:hypothetical protein XENOCAPTIV_006359 [Xenoophorus captivus]|uniref:Uncharacterized protein n=1 Tax=Xenoophorus captivus TaxID=1517983 RepID=A0ABV0R018_9TELE
MKMMDESITVCVSEMDPPLNMGDLNGKRPSGRASGLLPGGHPWCCYSEEPAGNESMWLCHQQAQQTSAYTELQRQRDQVASGSRDKLESSRKTRSSHSEPGA